LQEQKCSTFEGKRIPINVLKKPLSNNSSGKGITMDRVEYITMDEHDLEAIRHLWTQLNEHHQERASHFRLHYEQMTFDDRKKYFETIASTGILRLDLAHDPVSHRFVGYCVCSISSEKNGEIESIFVEPDYRSHHIGSDLVSRALAWMDARDVLRKRVSVGEGNEEAWQFYRKFGFYPRMTVLEQKTDWQKI
jgi:ribosomal protein S18 acetylase RimI-like enzyme